MLLTESKLPRVVVVDSSSRILFAQVMDHYKEFLEAQGQPELAAVAATSQQWEAGFDLEALPDVLQADLPPQPSQVSHS